MLLLRSETLHEGPEWIHELKLDYIIKANPSLSRILCVRHTI
jgi:hypothetical protein